MRIHGLKNCDTCRKALKSLPQAELVDIRATSIPPDLLARAFAQFGDDLVNRRSTTWRGLSETERAEAPLTLLAAYPTLMKRPLIEVDGALFLGWNAVTKRALGVG